MQSLLRSMTPGAARRAPVDDGRAAARRPAALVDLAQLAANLDQLLPGGLGERVRFGGDEPLGLEAALAQIGRLQALDRLEDAARRRRVGPADLGRDRPRRGRATCSATTRPATSTRSTTSPRRLEEAGYLTRDGERLELTPRGSRRIGQKVLDDLFARLQRDAFGGHRIDRGGRGGERDETTKPYEFGDPFHLDLRGTLANALGREENAPAARAATGDRRVRLAPADFEVYRTEQLTRTSTVLLVDMSRSMLLRGCFLAAKKVAVALDTLIRTQYPRDHLAVIGFAYYAREIRPGALAELTWHGYEYGTNLQHGLLLARRILARQRGGEQGDRGHHRRRADRPLRGRPGRVQLPADAADDPGDPARGRSAARRRGSRSTRSCSSGRGRWPSSSAHMTRLNRGRAFYADARAPRRVRPRRLRQPAHEARVVEFRATAPRLRPAVHDRPGPRGRARRERPMLAAVPVPARHGRDRRSFGPTFAFPIIASQAAEEPQHGALRRGRSSD